MSKVERIVLWIFAFGIWVYLGFRSYSIPLIHDETVTYYLYFQSGNFIPPWAYWDANNHLLHSAIGALFHHFFSPSPFTVRLGSWLSFIPYVWFLKGIVSLFPSKVSRWTTLLVLLSTPFFIEFFSLARGYGMAMTWFLGTLYFAMKYAHQPNMRWIVAMSLCGFLASLSNLSVIVAVLLVYLWVLLVQLHHFQNKYFSRIVQWFLIGVLPQLPLVYYGFLLQEMGLLYYGGDEPVKYFFQPLARYFLNNRESWELVVAVMSLTIIGYVVFFFRNGWKEVFQPTRIFPVIFSLSILSIFAQNWILHTHFPEDRAALFLFPLIVISWITFPYFTSWKAVALIPLLYFPIDLVKSANVEYSKLWPNEHVPARFWEKVDAQKGEYPLSLSAYFLRNGIWNFHSLNKPFSSCPQSAGYPSPWADALLVDSVRIQQLDLHQFIVADYDSVSGQTLLFRNPKLTETIRMDTVIRNLKAEGMYSNLVEFQAHKWGREPMALYYDIDIHASSDILHLHVITTLFDTSGAELFSAKNDLSLVSEHWKSIPNWRIKQFLPPFPENAGRFVSYIYNPQNEKHFLPQVHAKLASLSSP